MPTWRLLNPDTHNAFANMAIDEAILRARTEKAAPNTLRFYRWRPSAVSIGRFQNIHTEVHVNHCQTHGIHVVRRISGGGAVYHDSRDEITYSVIVKQADLHTNDIAKAYHHVCNGLIEAARRLGVEAGYNKGTIKQCPNITVRNRKLSGSAQAHKRGVILQHGTLLVRVDLEKMFTFLKAPWKGAGLDCLRLARCRITSVVDELGHQVPMDGVYEALIQGFEKALGVSLVHGSLTDSELRLAEKLEKGKFATHAWNFEGKSDL